MAEGEAPLISVDCTLAFLTDVNGFLDPSREAVRFPVNDGSIRPVDEMVFLSRMVSEGGFIVLCEAGGTLTPGEGSAGSRIHFFLVLL